MNRASQVGNIFGRGLVGLSIGAVVFDQIVYTVPPGHRGLVFQRVGMKQGLLPGSKSPGVNFLIPVVQYPIFMETRTQARLITTRTPTKDLQRVDLELRVLARPQKDNLSKIQNEIGPDVIDTILPSIGNEVLKSVVAKYNAAELLTLREEVSREVRKELSSRAKAFYLDLDDVSLTHLSFAKEFAKAIEDKQVEQQVVEKQKFVVFKKEQERQALIIRSEGDSEAAKLISAALEKSGTGLVELRRIETAEHIAQDLAKTRNVTYLPGGNNILMNMQAGGR